MNENIHIEETLWNYIDGSLGEEETTVVEKLLQSDATWKSKYEDLLEVHTLMLGNIGLEQPSMRFTRNVMEEISRQYITPATSSYINKYVIRGIGLFFLISIVGLLVYGFGQVNWAEAGSATAIDRLDWSRIYNSSYANIIIIANILLGLMLLDMVLTRKKRKIAANP